MKIDTKQLNFIDVSLMKVLIDAEESIGVEFIATSLYRINDHGVHGTLPLRGFDLRMRSELVGKAIEKFINSRWFYDKKRPELKVCLLHGDGYSMHLHIQSHPNTTRKPIL